MTGSCFPFEGAQRLYVVGQDDFDRGGYPLAWATGEPAIKDLVREQAGHRCVRCGHPYRKGQHGSGEWSSCDERCEHRGPIRLRFGDGDWNDEHQVGDYSSATAADWLASTIFNSPVTGVQARYRILTVHHLDGDKANCRWWNLAALCQRCHLEIQGRVVMDRVWPHEHSPWFRPYVAGYYAWRYLGEEITRDEAEQRIDELLGLEIRQLSLETA